MLWDLNEGKHLYTLDGGDIINALCFSPNRYWLCAATGPSIKIWVCPRRHPDGIPLGTPLFLGRAVMKPLMPSECLRVETQRLFLSAPRAGSGAGSGAPGQDPSFLPLSSCRIWKGKSSWMSSSRR